MVAIDPKVAQRLGAFVAGRPDDEDAWTALRKGLADFYAADDARPDRTWVTRVRLARQHPALVGQLRTHFSMLEASLVEHVARRLPGRSSLEAGLVTGLALTTVRVLVGCQDSRDLQPPPPAGAQEQR